MPTQDFSAQINKILTRPEVQAVQEQSRAFYSNNLGLFKAVSILLTVFFVASTIFFVIKTGWLALRISRVRDVILKADLPKKRSIRIWKRVQRHFFAGDENSLKLALLEADKILDEALRVAGFKGETLVD